MGSNPVEITTGLCRPEAPCCSSRSTPRSLNGADHRHSPTQGVRFTTSLFPRDGTYLLPIKLAVRIKTGVTVGDAIDVEMTVGVRG